MPNKIPARILCDVKRITKFLSQKRRKPSLSITFVNRIEIPKPKLSLSKIVCIEFPSVPKSSSNDNNEELKKQNDQLKHDVNVLNFILQSYKQDETNQDDVNLRLINILKKQDKNPSSVITATLNMRLLNK